MLITWALAPNTTHYGLSQHFHGWESQSSGTRGDLMISAGLLGKLLLSFHYNNIDPSGNIIQSVSPWLSLTLLLGKTIFILSEKEVLRTDWWFSCLSMYACGQVEVPGTKVFLKSCQEPSLLLPANIGFFHAGQSTTHVLKPFPGLSVFLCWL